MSAENAIPLFPARPHQGIAFSAPLSALIGEYERHMRYVVVNRPGVGDGPDLFAHAVAALALLHTITDRLFQARWATLRDALASDVARAPEAVAACGLDSTEVAAGLRSWSDDQVNHGLMEPWEAGIVDLMARSVEEVD